MTYYLLEENDTQEDAMYDENTLGESSFDNFYPSEGLRILMHIVQNTPERLPKLRIIKQTGEKLSVEQFLTEISSLKVKYNKF